MAVSRSFKIAMGTGVALVAAAGLWVAVAVPAVVKYPTDLNVTPEYAGTFRLYVNPATGAPLAAPQELPLTIDRHLDADGSASGATRVVVTETITQKAGTLLSAVQTNSYVLDRRSMKNVADGRAYSFDPSNVVDRSGSYRLQFPMGTDADKSYPVYKNETGTTYSLTPDSTATGGKIEGLDVDYFKAQANEVPLSAAYVAGLRKLVPLPATMTFDQLQARLSASGVDLDPILTGLRAALTPAERTALTQALAQPINLSYVSTFDGRVAIEPDTGTEVDIVGVKETIGVRPLLNLAPIQALLAKYATVPAVKAATPVFAGLASAPATPVFQYDYAQTAASVADIAGEAKDMRGNIMMAERWIPLGLLALGMVILLGGAATRLRGRVKSGPPERPAATPPKPAHYV